MANQHEHVPATFLELVERELNLFRTMPHTFNGTIYVPMQSSAGGSVYVDAPLTGGNAHLVKGEHDQVSTVGAGDKMFPVLMKRNDDMGAVPGSDGQYAIPSGDEYGRPRVAVSYDGQEPENLDEFLRNDAGDATIYRNGSFASASGLTTSYAKLLDVRTAPQAVLWMEITNATNRSIHIAVSEGGTAPSDTAPVDLDYIILPDKSLELQFALYGTRLTEDVYIKRPAGSASTGDGVTVHAMSRPWS